MGYCASWDGFLKMKSAPSEEMMKDLAGVFEEAHFDDNQMGTEVCGYGKYHEDDVEGVLTNVESIVESGEIEFTGEDGAHWRFIFKDGHWKEEYGYVFYDSEISDAKNDREEFLGGIIDIMQDAMDNPEGEIIEGKWYDKIRDELETMMKAWKVLD